MDFATKVFEKRAESTINLVILCLWMELNNFFFALKYWIIKKRKPQTNLSTLLRIVMHLDNI